MLPLAIAACGSTKFIPKTELVDLKVDAALTEPVASCSSEVRTNEDLDHKALRCEAALAEANERLADIRRSQDEAIARVKDQSGGSWWTRLFGGGK